jgi:predicted DNA-binding transcriptional regulator YafY
MLAKAAQDLIAKIAAAVPERLRPLVLEPSIGASTQRNIPPDAIDMVGLRNHIRNGRKLTLRYRDEKGQETTRHVWPVTIGYMETVRMLAAWCELRRDFRHFRTDRIVEANFLEDRYPERPALLRAKWRKMMKEEKKASDA